VRRRSHTLENLADALADGLVDRKPVNADLGGSATPWVSETNTGGYWPNIFEHGLGWRTA